MPREITSHKVNKLNEALKIDVMDEPGAGGENHKYQIDGPTRQITGIGIMPSVRCDIRFQNGPIAEAGVNGISNEALMAIIEDRLKSFQAGPYACRENALALTHLQESMHWLKHRTEERIRRGVEGASAK